VCSALNTLDADWEGKVQSRVSCLTRLTFLSQALTFAGVCDHLRAAAHKGLTPARAIP